MAHFVRALRPDFSCNFVQFRALSCAFVRFRALLGEASLGLWSLALLVFRSAFPISQLGSPILGALFVLVSLGC